MSDRPWYGFLPMQSPGAVHEASEHDDAEEGALIERIKRKDRAAFESLYRRYRPRLRRFLGRLVTENEAAEEIVNDVLFAVWKGANGYAGRAKVSTWIFGIAYRQALRVIERAAKERRRRADVVVLDNTGSYAVDGPEQSLVDARYLEACLARLSAEQRLVVELTFFLGFSYEEIAQVAECPVNTVKTRMFRARCRLRELINEPGVAIDD